MKLGLFAAVALIGLSVSGAEVQAKGKGGGHSGHSSRSHSSHSKPIAPGPGTGSKGQSTQVRGYLKKDGKYVAPSRRSTPDHNFRNNWSTKGNTNPTTGKQGTQVEPPKQR
jgi:hypothetical protein